MAKSNDDKNKKIPVNLFSMDMHVGKGKKKEAKSFFEIGKKMGKRDAKKDRKK
jgi:hypothetical protein